MSHDPAAVRAWARETGRPVGERGRLSPELVGEYDRAHAAQVTTPKVARPSVARDGVVRAVDA